VFLDCLYERKGPFNPGEVCVEIAALLKSYGLYAVTGDRYSASWVGKLLPRAASPMGKPISAKKAAKAAKKSLLLQLRHIEPLEEHPMTITVSKDVDAMSARRS
jgi:hypothetical protein